MTVSSWLTLARQCLLRRVSVQRFGDFLRSHDSEIDGKRLFGALVECRESFCQPGDPLISLYIDHIVVTGIIAISDGLIILTRRWNDTKFPASQNTLACYNDTLQDLTMIIVSPKYKAGACEARLALQISSRWLCSLARQASRGDPGPSELELNNTIEFLAFLMASMAATDAGFEALSPPESQGVKVKHGSVYDLRTSVKQAFELCLPLYSMLSSQLMERINTVLKHINLLDEGASQAGNATAPTSEIQALQFQVSIADSQLVASKAGTILYLEGLLFTGSTIDDGGTEGEAQPVYDDFGAIFLLILVSRGRLGLSKSSLGIRKKDGFLAQYLEHENSEESLESLSDEQKSHLGNWINALYLAEGLSDELFTNCSPHDFYPLIPTLLRQSMTAHQQGKLTHDSLQAGLDYLLEPFLLPSLISAMNWVAEVIQHERMVAGKVLETLMKPRESLESRDIHHTILTLCAPRLKMHLKAITSQDTNVDSILRILDECPDFSFFSERERQNPGPGILNILQHSLVTLITSTVALDIGDTAPFTDISAIVNRAVEVRGPHTTLRAIVGVLLQLSDNHAFLYALDTLTTVVCMAGNGLRDALRLQYHDLGSLLKSGETLTAEGVVRLHRQVETYTNLLAVPEMGLDSFNFTQQLTNIDTTNANLDSGTAVSGGMDIQTEQGQADGIDQVLDEVAAMGNLDSNDADMSFDALYDLQGNDMDLNDLDLDMF
ncbi:hypothetical protein AYL99_04730 [Fonsecaea erecta]|uniref:Mediator of RNA polymerase II transcription subunit 5 n=1 Tax=Fonsecaea erecta TaxID=1367422 RepID=A0A178ZTZ5_9EURO|nr:hypothetical protein AYL99_04730 [Fonsecaea erecta]OAP62525.1 hypothetical protein AYL99_04730 [Fonsecaea erecta]